MSKWLRRWIRTLRREFPGCQVTYRKDIVRHGWIVTLHWQRYYWGQLLNANPSPAVWQNRKANRQCFLASLRHALNAAKAKEYDKLSQDRIPQS